MNVKHLEKELSESRQEGGLAGGAMPSHFAALSGAGRGDKLFLYPQKIQPRAG